MFFFILYDCVSLINKTKKKPCIGLTQENFIKFSCVNPIQGFFFVLLIKLTQSYNIKKNIKESLL